MAKRAFLIVLCAVVQVALAEKPPIEFPEVEGWVRGTRWDQPRPQNTSIVYKAKVSKTYLTAEVRVFGQDQGGAPGTLEDKAVTEMLERLTREQLTSPIEKDGKASKAEAISLGGAGGAKAYFVRLNSMRGMDHWEKHLFLTIDRGHFVSILIGERPNFMKEGQPLIDKFAAAMGKAVSAK